MPWFAIVMINWTSQQISIMKQMYGKNTEPYKIKLCFVFEEENINDFDFLFKSVCSRSHLTLVINNWKGYTQCKQIKVLEEFKPSFLSLILPLFSVCLSLVSSCCIQLFIYRMISTIVTGLKLVFQVLKARSFQMQAALPQLTL